MRLTIILVLLVSARGGSAQVAIPAGLTRQATQSATLSGELSPSRVWSLRADNASEKSPLWQWALVGAVAGGAIGAAVGAKNVSRSDDAFFPQLAIGEGIAIGVLGGAAVGGVLGAIYNGIAHPGAD